MTAFSVSKLSLALIVLFTFSGLLVCGQVNNPNDDVSNNLIGVWGMFKDKHPDGWGSFNPPYMYFEFLKNNHYNRIFTHRKGNSIFLGTYDVVGDSLIVLNESIGTNGKVKGPIKTNTLKIHVIQSDLLELWEDWDRVLSKGVKRWGHKQKYRRLTVEENEKLETVKRKLMDDYSRIQD